MANAFTRPYLDANIYIAALAGPGSEDPAKVSMAAALLQLAEDGHYQVIASTFIAAEVVKAPGTSPMTQQQEDLIAAYFRREFIVVYEVDLLVAEKARQLCRDFALKPPDAVHVATAIRAGCDQFLTWDEKVHKDGRTIESVFVTEPHLTGHQTSIFDD